MNAKLAVQGRETPTRAVFGSSGLQVMRGHLTSRTVIAIFEVGWLLIGGPGLAIGGGRRLSRQAALLGTRFEKTR